MADIKRISNKNTITNGTEETNLSLSDILLTQHVSGDNSDYQVTFAQAQAVPYGVCNSASGENKTVTFSNYPSDFTAQVGTKILVKFTNKNTLGSVSAGTYPTLTAGGVTKPILAKGKTVASGVPFANQIAELTLTPDGWNIDQDAREVTTSYQINADGTNSYNVSQVNGALADYNYTSFVANEDLNTVKQRKGTNATAITTSLQNVPSGWGALSTGDLCFVDFYPINADKTRGFQVLTSVLGNSDKTKEKIIQWKRSLSSVGWGDWYKIIDERDINSTLANQIVTFNTDGFTVSPNISNPIRKSGKIVVLNLYGYTSKEITKNTAFMKNLPKPATPIHIIHESFEYIVDTNGNLYCTKDLTFNKWIVTEIVYIEA